MGLGQACRKPKKPETMGRRVTPKREFRDSKMAFGGVCPVGNRQRCVPETMAGPLGDTASGHSQIPGWPPGDTQSEFRESRNALLSPEGRHGFRRASLVCLCACRCGKPFPRLPLLDMCCTLNSCPKHVFVFFACFLPKRYGSPIISAVKGKT